MLDNTAIGSTRHIINQSNRQIPPLGPPIYGRSKIGEHVNGRDVREFLEPKIVWNNVSTLE